jgi:hypothetical protein
MEVISSTPFSDLGDYNFGNCGKTLIS